MKNSKQNDKEPRSGEADRQNKKEDKKKTWQFDLKGRQTSFAGQE